jgi:hypothetical protein
MGRAAPAAMPPNGSVQPTIGELSVIGDPWVIPTLGRT